MASYGAFTFFLCNESYRKRFCRLAQVFDRDRHDLTAQEIGEAAVETVGGHLVPVLAFVREDVAPKVRGKKLIFAINLAWKGFDEVALALLGLQQLPQPLPPFDGRHV